VPVGLQIWVPPAWLGAADATQAIAAVPRIKAIDERMDSVPLCDRYKFRWSRPQAPAELKERAKLRSTQY
jgi:hypothetical protein